MKNNLFNNNGSPGGENQNESRRTNKNNLTVIRSTQTITAANFGGGGD